MQIFHHADSASKSKVVLLVSHYFRTTFMLGNYNDRIIRRQTLYDGS